VTQRSWAGSDRRERLPDNWLQLRQAVFARDGWQCVMRTPSGQRCPQPAQECDHINPGDDHSMSNLRSLCKPHHASITGAQGGSRVHKRARMAHPLKRRPERHPGDPS
jgi:5-methylcytosine-specific restriction protein A